MDSSHGSINTPVFMPVGTAATVKSLCREDLEGLGAQIILANNYHLFLRPGSSNVKKLGGLHKFMNWPHPILTDSGGFQVQSLSADDVAMCKIDEDGVTFRSHLDGGSLHRFTPQIATKSQIDLGADIVMAFDDSTPPNATHARTLKALDRTHRWLSECIKTWKSSSSKQTDPPALFGIIQGGTYPDLRQQSARFVIDCDLPGIAIGGASIGTKAQETAENIAFVREMLPKNKPLYAMGVGVTPSDLVSVIKAGADMFDCVAPTRLARCGQLYHPEPKTEYLDISKSQFKLDKKVINSGCDCSTCTSGYSRAYLHHLFKAKELLYHKLATIHNLRTMIRTVEKERSQAIITV
ncbi:hypothetical protein A2397_02280 [Candidatus Amesbacteria bacterium RIFOXYB1_FULL_44_23]|uniref:tRNA-guanine(15) transglycosylase-like domain-containing protein n=1 Tax=Candidatus Amesbacteria bacterium RIFOXYB1_FULL_44_23 TaxID=1797263 RepID=A0A1F4ZSX2_9BACT|nr:MAG: hypothetical protein A2397_02280 [Candidatus Amesbacteria bacterium RIFOXYB1_FULL_44_23]